MAQFGGTSWSGNFQEALTDAVNHAQAAFPPDTYVDWQFVLARGRRGGLVGMNGLQVVIEANPAKTTREAHVAWPPAPQ